jgi:hypothetical protein
MGPSDNFITEDLPMMSPTADKNGRRLTSAAFFFIPRLTTLKYVAGSPNILYTSGDLSTSEVIHFKLMVRFRARTLVEDANLVSKSRTRSGFFKMWLLFSRAYIIELVKMFTLGLDKSAP